MIYACIVGWWINSRILFKDESIELIDINLSWKIIVKGTESVKIDNMFKIDFIGSNELRRIQLQFATNRIKISLLEPEIQPAKGCTTSLLWAYDVTCCHKPAAGNNITCNTLQLLFDCRSTSVRHTRNFRCSVTSGRNFRCLWEEVMFVIYSSTRKLCYYPHSCKVAFLNFESFHR